jgi:dolichyl-phosphate-mannose-protein mannosyltransferase
MSLPVLDHSSKKQQYYCCAVFACLTFLLLFTKHAVFSSYNGADDLHYAMLSSRMLNHQFNPFLPYDAFAGRVIPIFWQACWFEVFGINDFSMQMPSLSILIVLAFVICFKSGIPRKPSLIALATSLVYFNPVVFQSTLGNLPDIYIAFVACVVFLIIRKHLIATENNIRDGILVGILLTAGLLMKETILFVYVSAFIVLIIFCKKTNQSFLYAALIATLTGCAAWALLFYVKTGDPFFRFQQLKNNAYLNDCSYQCYSVTGMLKRLTVMLPEVFIESGFFPVLLVMAFLLCKKRLNTLFSSTAHFYIVSFAVIALTAIYFPLSIHPYIPLCHDSRHFLFLLPIAILLFVSVLNEIELNKKDGQLLFGICTAVLFLSAILNIVVAPFNKWMIMDESLLGICFAVMMIGKEKIIMVFTGIIIPAVLWLSVAYPLYKKEYHGYASMKAMRGMQRSMTEDDNMPNQFFYFTDHDTKMHYELADKFDPATNYISLDTIEPGLVPYRQYQSEGMFKDSSLFKKGWLIINPNYTPMDTTQLNSINALLEQQSAMRTGYVRAYFVSSSIQFKQLLTIINDTSTIKPVCSCGK